MTDTITLTVKFLVAKENDRIVGYEIKVGDEWFCIFENQQLPGIRLGRMVPSWDKPLEYDEIYSSAEDE